MDGMMTVTLMTADGQPLSVPLASAFEKGCEVGEKQQWDSPSTSQQLDLYAFGMQGYKGDCDLARPSITDVVGRFKWNAWTKVKGMSQQEAQRQYVQLLLLISSAFHAWVRSQENAGALAKEDAAAPANEEAAAPANEEAVAPANEEATVVTNEVAAAADVAAAAAANEVAAADNEMAAAVGSDQPIIPTPNPYMANHNYNSQTSTHTLKKGAVAMNGKGGGGVQPWMHIFQQNRLLLLGVPIFTSILLYQQQWDAVALLAVLVLQMLLSPMLYQAPPTASAAPSPMAAPVPSFSDLRAQVCELLTDEYSHQRWQLLHSMDGVSVAHRHGCGGGVWRVQVLLPGAVQDWWNWMCQPGNRCKWDVSNSSYRQLQQPTMHTQLLHVIQQPLEGAAAIHFNLHQWEGCVAGCMHMQLAHSIQLQQVQHGAPQGTTGLWATVATPVGPEHTQVTLFFQLAGGGLQLLPLWVQSMHKLQQVASHVPAAAVVIASDAEGERQEGGQQKQEKWYEILSTAQPLLVAGLTAYAATGILWRGVRAVLR